MRLPPPERLKPFALPAVFAVFFLLFLLLTFPFEEIARRIESEVREAGGELTLGSLRSSGPFSLRARDVRLRLAPDAPQLRFARVDLKPDLLPLLVRRVGFGFALEGYGGRGRGHARLSSDSAQPGLAALALQAEGVDLQALPPPPDAELSGRLSLQVDLPALLPVEVASGRLSLSIKGAAILRAKARLEGGMAMALPHVALGDIDAAAVLEKGVVRVERIAARGGDVEADVEGTVRLRPMLELSQADLHARLRPSERFIDQNPIVRGGLGFLGPRASDGSYTVSAAGPLSRLSPRPGR